MRVHLIVPTWQRPDLLDACCRSIAEQTDRPDTVTVTDDASTDPDVAEVMAMWAVAWGWTMVYRTRNVGALANLTDAIRHTPMAPDDVVLLVDGDDALEPHCVETVRLIYRRSDTLLAYGSYRPNVDCPGCPPARPVPYDVLAAGTIREYSAREGWFNHPLSFRRALFDRLDDIDLTIDGEPIRWGYDLALMVPMAELAGTRIHFEHEVLYRYTADRDDSGWLADPAGNDACGQYVLGMGRRYEPIDWSELS